MQGQIGENKQTNSKNKNRKQKSENPTQKIPNTQKTIKVWPTTAIPGALGAVWGSFGKHQIDASEAILQWKR
jgi:hypothetical protein